MIKPIKTLFFNPDQSSSTSNQTIRDTKVEKMASFTLSMMLPSVLSKGLKITMEVKYTTCTNRSPDDKATGANDWKAISQTTMMVLRDRSKKEYILADLVSLMPAMYSLNL